MLRHFAEGAFGSRHLNLLNLHLGIVNFGQILRLSVNAVFLKALGLSMPGVLLAMAGFFVLRWASRTPLIIIPHRFGSKPALVVGQVFFAAAFAVYSQVNGPGPLMLLAIALTAAGEGLYWHAVHTTFATLAEDGKFGRQLAARGIFMGIGGLLAPITAGFVEHYASWTGVFLLAAASVVISIIPLFFMPEPCPPKPIDWRKGFAVNKAGMKLFGGWGALSAVLAVIWQLVIYVEMGTVIEYGALATVTALLGFLLSIFVARRIDLGKGKGVVVWGAALYAVVVLAQAAFGRDAATIVALSMVMTLAGSCFTQPYNASLYRWAKETHDPLWFHYWSEFGWDMGNALVLFGAALALWLAPAIDLRWTMLLSIPAIIWCYHVYVTDGGDKKLTAAQQAVATANKAEAETVA